MKYKLLELSSTYTTIQKHIRILFTNIYKAIRIQININLLWHDAFLHKCDYSRHLTVVVTAPAQAQSLYCQRLTTHFSHPFSLPNYCRPHTILPSPDLSVSLSQWPAPFTFHFCMSTLEFFSRLMKWKHRVFLVFTKNSFKNTPKNIVLDSWYYDLLFF